TIHFHANAPQLAMQCNKQAAIFNTYNCQVINNNLSNKAVVYTTSTPTGKNFTINQNTGLLSGILTTSSTIPFTITAANEYGAKNTLSSDVTGFKYGCGMIELDGGPWDETGSLRNQDGYYRTIKLGDRCWLADNLRQDKNPAHTNGACRDNSNINCDAEGSVYPTTDASNASLCPSGWHVANDYNYQQLLDSVGGDITVLELNGLAGINLLLNGQKYLTDSNCIPAGGYTYGKNYWTTGGGVNSPKNFSNFCIAATTGYLRCVQDIPCAQTCGAAQTCDLGSGLCVCKPTLSAANYPAYSQSCSGYLSDGCNNTVPNPGKLDCTKFGSTNNCDVNTGKCGACTNVGEIYSTVTKSCVCPNNMTAVNGQCACGLGVCNNAQTCSGGTCIAVTNTPTNCASGTVWDSIQNGCCKDPAWPAPAVYANKCTGITTAASAACHGAKLTINPGKFASCSGKCADEDDGCGNQCPDPCASGESCSGGVCTATADGPCKKDADCSGGQVCGAGGNCCKVHYAYDSDPGIRSRYCGPNPGKEYGSCYYSNDIDWGDWGADTPHMVSFDLLADQTHQFYKNLTPVACPAGSVCIANFCRNTGIACAESASNPATDSDLAGYLSMGMAGSCEVCLRSFIRLFDAVSYDDAHCIKDSKTAEVTCASDTSNCVSKGVYFKNQKTSDNSSCNNNPSSGCHTENICCGSAGVITSGQTGCIWDDAGCAGNSVFNTSIKNTQIFWGAGN
ncbi:MAG: FISUMP domain-containing protein, partial [Candidatus Falkowbacteria bacterium]